ncbi:hypothetical protein SDC9_111503 [bioreactor metagenome]|uniref:Uncharacterized protein n=1 Tax=bioreactor metagenome TaxID=1076179 RepID=A0A645BHG5_9ZZZZ
MVGPIGSGQHYGSLLPGDGGVRIPVVLPSALDNAKVVGNIQSGQKKGLAALCLPAVVHNTKIALQIRAKLNGNQRGSFFRKVAPSYGQAEIRDIGSVQNFKV